MSAVARRSVTAGVVAFTIAACGGSSTPIDPGPGGGGEDLAFLAGSWDATVFRMTSQANASLRVDLLASGASFTLAVQRSGRYEATLTALGQSSTELGQMREVGTKLELRPINPAGPAEQVDWRLVGDTLLVLDGPSEFDFNLDGSSEASIAHIELVR